MWYIFLISLFAIYTIWRIRVYKSIFTGLITNSAKTFVDPFYKVYFFFWQSSEDFRYRAVKEFIRTGY